jgi:hypothetical protein
MAIFNPVQRQETKDQIWPTMLQLNQYIQDDKTIWQKIPYEKRKSIIDDNRDPIMSMLFLFYKKLHNNWFGPKFYDQKEFE